MLINRLQDSGIAQQNIKKAAYKALSNYFVYEMDMDPPHAIQVDFAEESDYSWSITVDPLNETVSFNVEVNAWSE